MAVSACNCLGRCYRVASRLVTNLFRAERRLLGWPAVRTDFAPQGTVTLPAGGTPTGGGAPDPRGPSETGNYFASVAIVPVPLATVRRLLPRRLEPAPQSLTPAGQHPLMLMFGYQWDVRPPLQPPPGMEYLEVIAATPYVRWAGSGEPHAGPFVYMPRLYLDKLLPTVLGWLCGYAKRLGRMAVDSASYEVRPRWGGARLIRGTFQPHGDPGSPADFPYFAPVRDIFQQTFVGRTRTGLYPCTRIIFDLGRAEMQGIRTEVLVGSQFLPGVNLPDFTSEGIDTQPLGSFRLRTRWRLIPPFPCPRDGGRPGP